MKNNYLNYLFFYIFMYMSNKKEKTRSIELFDNVTYVYSSPIGSIIVVLAFFCFLYRIFSGKIVDPLYFLLECCISGCCAPCYLVYCLFTIGKDMRADSE